MKIFSVSYPKKEEDFQKIKFYDSKYVELLKDQFIHDSSKFQNLNEFKVRGAKSAPAFKQL